MDLLLTESEHELRRRARDFAERHLIPHELLCEAEGGLPADLLGSIKAAVVEWRFNAINQAEADGGRGHDLFEQALVSEQWGRTTGALWDIPWRPAIPLRFATEDQKDEYLRPACRGERRDAYAITEEGAGSDTSLVTTNARRDGSDWVINGEKWHVTTGDVADFFLVHALADGDHAKPTVFIVDKDLPGVRLVRTPKYMHTFVFEHPIFAFEDVRVGPDKVLGEVGGGDDLTRKWFVEERLMIGARTVGAAARALELSTEFANERLQFGTPIASFQGVGFMLADMAAELAAAQALLYRVAWQAGRGNLAAKELHALAATVKLVCSETAGRIVDRAVQIHGGRGYMREFAVERLWRELRVDRIWEGTSEIQRVIIGNHLRKRGPAAFTDWT
ncbi:MAG: acyl-CoA dehydrogenase family protein [Actinomycetota bacterium]